MEEIRNTAKFSMECGKEGVAIRFRASGSRELPRLEPHSLENQVAIHPSCWDWIRTPWGVAQELAGKQSMLSLEYAQ